MSVVPTIAHKPRRRKSINWQRYDELKAQGESDTAIAPLLGMSQPGLSHRKKTQHLDELTPPSTSEPSSQPGSPTTALQKNVVVGEPVGFPRLDTLESRIDVLETFIATLQQQPTYFPGSPNGLPAVHPSQPLGLPGSPRGSPTHKRGFVMADDLFEAIHTYAQAHHLQVKTVLDSALRKFFARRGWPAEEGRPDA